MSTNPPTNKKEPFRKVKFEILSDLETFMSSYSPVSGLFPVPRWHSKRFESLNQLILM